MRESLHSVICGSGGSQGFAYKEPSAPPLSMGALDHRQGIYDLPVTACRPVASIFLFPDSHQDWCHLGINAGAFASETTAQQQRPWSHKGSILWQE